MLEERALLTLGPSPLESIPSLTALEEPPERPHHQSFSRQWQRLPFALTLHLLSDSGCSSGCSGNPHPSQGSLSAAWMAAL